MKILNIFYSLAIFYLSLSFGFLSACKTSSNFDSQENLSSDTIHLGSVLPLEGREEAFGNSMRAGLKAALAGETVKGKTLKLSFRNDFYEPYKSLILTNELVNEGAFLMIGNVGMITAKSTLPVLREQNIPAVGFLSGANFLRIQKDSVVNYRASYGQEIATLVNFSLENGLRPQEICAYVESNPYGFAGILHLQKAFNQAKVTSKPFPLRNNIGPVGVYPPNTPYVEEGYKSLKQWEQDTGNQCKLIITAGAYSNLARFAQLATEKNENWIIATVSLTGADNFQLDLEEYGAQEKIIMTQVVPLLNSSLPIVQEAQQKLGEEFDFISLEGYIVGKITLKILKDIPGELNRANFMAQVAQSKFNLGGLEIDFTQGRNQGSDLVIVSHLTASGYEVLDSATFTNMLK